MGQKGKRASDAAVYAEGRRAFLAERYGLALKIWKPIADHPAMRPVLAETHLRRGLMQGLMEDFEQALRVEPGDLRALRVLVRSCLRSGDLERARRAIVPMPKTKEILEISRLVEAAGSRGSWQTQNRYELLLLDLNSGREPSLEAWPAALRPVVQTAEALLGGKAAPAASGRLAGPARALSDLFRAAAVAARGKGDVAGAARSLGPSGMAERQTLEHAVARRLMGLAIMGDRTEEAELLLQRFKDAFSTAQEQALHVRLGELAYAQMRFRDAAEHWQQARASYSLDQAIALAREADHDTSAAIEMWERVLRAEERRLGRSGASRLDLAKVYLHLARLHWQSDDFARAAQHYERAQAAGEPEDPSVLREYAQCLDLLEVQPENALALHLKYLMRVPGDLRTAWDIVEDLLTRSRISDALQVMGALGELPEGEYRQKFRDAATFAAFSSLARMDEPTLLRSAQSILRRMPEAERPLGPVDAVIAALDGRGDEAAAILRAVNPPEELDDMAAWCYFIEGAAWLRLGHPAAGRGAFDRTLEDGQYDLGPEIATIHCIMHRERTGAESCAGTPEGEAVEYYLRRTAIWRPQALFDDFPRRVKACRHFREALGRARNEIDLDG